MIIKHNNWKGAWDGGFTMGLFVKFLKKHGLVHQIYGQFCEERKVMNNFWFWHNEYPNIYCIGTLYMKCACPNICQSSYLEKDLVLNQLWRFEILKNIEEYRRICPSESLYLFNHIKVNILINGNRGSEELKTLFEKYNFKQYSFGRYRQ